MKWLLSRSTASFGGNLVTFSLLAQPLGIWLALQTLSALGSHVVILSCFSYRSLAIPLLTNSKCGPSLLQCNPSADAVSYISKIDLTFTFTIHLHSYASVPSRSPRLQAARVTFWKHKSDYVFPSCRVLPCLLTTPRMKPKLWALPYRGLQYCSHPPLWSPQNTSPDVLFLWLDLIFIYVI